MRISEIISELQKESVVRDYFNLIGNQLQISGRMDIICAGFPKTGSKSCSAALRTLGYNVADYPETLEFLGETWWKFMNGDIDANSVIDKYKVRVYQRLGDDLEQISRSSLTINVCHFV